MRVSQLLAKIVDQCLIFLKEFVYFMLFIFLVQYQSLDECLI